jgi:hypothetical protein
MPVAWGGLRFPNPGANIPRMVDSFAVVHASVTFGEPFGMDHIAEQLAMHYLAGSSGAAGKAAAERSYNSDRSRDPLYNQAKMYAEIWRMLGLVHPTASRLEFASTQWARALIDDADGVPSCQWGIVRESLIGITFPNPNVHQTGVQSQRPFAWALQLIAALDGWITRDELIIGLLAVTDDQRPRILNDTVASIRAHRAGDTASGAVEALAGAAAVQVNTLRNYTRFPLGVLRDPTIGWGARETATTPYKEKDTITRLLPRGRSTAARLADMTDLRGAELADLPEADVAAVALFTHYLGLERAGFSSPELAAALAEAGCHAGPALASLGVSEPNNLLLGPWQQLDRATLNAASALVA